MLSRANLGRAYWDEIASFHPRITFVRAEHDDWIEGLTGIARLPLSNLGLLDCPRVTDLGPLSEVGGLERLELTDGSPLDLAPLATLSALRTLKLHDLTGEVNLAPLAGLRNLMILLKEGQQVSGTGSLHRTVKLDWWAGDETLE
jgi:hypothetical protein